MSATWSKDHAVKILEYAAEAAIPTPRVEMDNGGAYDWKVRDIDCIPCSIRLESSPRRRFMIGSNVSFCFKELTFCLKRSIFACFDFLPCRFDVPETPVDLTGFESTQVGSVVELPFEFSIFIENADSTVTNRKIFCYLSDAYISVTSK